MEEFNDFWDLLPSKDAVIGQHLRDEFLSASEEHDSSGENSDESGGLCTQDIQSLRFALSDYPFPTFQLVNALKRVHARKIFDDLEYFTVLNAVENISESNEFAKFFCMLTNFNLTADKYEKFCKQILQIIVDKVNEGVLDARSLALCLLSRKDDLAVQYFQVDRKSDKSQDQTRSLFIELIQNRRNAIYDITRGQFVDYQETVLQEYMAALKICNIVNEIETEDVPIQCFLSKIGNNAVYNGENQLLQVYLLELERQKRVLSFFCNNSQMHLVKYYHFSQNRRVLYDVLENVEITPHAYDCVNDLFTENDKLSARILEIYNPCDNKWRHDDLEYFTMILTAKLLLNSILLDESLDDYVTLLNQNFTDMKTVIRNVNNLDRQLTLASILFTLIFMRYENWELRPLKVISSDSTSDGEEDHHPATESAGSFMCGEQVISATLNLLKNFLLKIKRSHAITDEMDQNRQLNLQNLLEATNDALYRLKIVFKCTSMYMGGNLKIHSFHYGTLVKFHIDADGGSSDENDDSTIERRFKRRKFKNRASPESDKASTTCGSEQVLLDMKTSYTDKGRPKKLINKMLSAPDTLAVLCASRGDINEMKNIIKQYHLETSAIDQYVTFMDQFEAIKFNLQCKSTAIATSAWDSEFEAAKISSFASNNPIHQPPEELELISTYRSTYPFLSHYHGEGLTMTSIIDLMLSLPCTLEQNQFLYNQIGRVCGRIAGENGHNIGYFDFLHNLIEFLEYYKHINDEEATIAQLLNTEFYCLDRKALANQIAKLELFRKLQKHDGQSFTSASTLEDKCYQIPDVFKVEINYFQRVINYLSAVTSLLDFHNGEFNFDPDSLLNLNLDRLIGEIVNIYKVPPVEIEHFVTQLGKNLVHVLICYNLCPVISQNNVSGREETAILDYLHSCLKNEVGDIAKYDSNESSLKMTSSYLLPFIDRSNKIAAQLIREMHSMGLDTDLNMSALKRFASLDQIQVLSQIYMSNPIFTALNYDSTDLRLLHKFLLSTHSYKDGVHVIESIKELQYRKNQIQLDKIKDIFVCHLIDSSNETHDYQYMTKIVNFNLKAEYVNKHLYKIKDSRLARRLLQDLFAGTHDKSLMPTYEKQIKDWIFELNVYEKIAVVLDELDWLQVREKSINEPDDILYKIFDNISELKEILPQWIQLHPLRNIQFRAQIDNIFDSFMKFLGQNENEEYIQLLFQTAESFATDRIIELYELLLLGVKNLPSLTYIIQYLAQQSKKHEKYQKYQMSIKIYECLSTNEVRNLWHLMTRPLLILEQYLMNSKFEVLTKIFQVILPLLTVSTVGCNLCRDPRASSNNLSNLMRLTNASKSSSESGSYIMINYDSSHIDEFITIDCISSLLKVYASKALQFRISERYHFTTGYSILSRVNVDLKTAMQQFTMPKNPPTKQEWTLDEDTVKCMCCALGFTLLTRRHHCRRCGRVVCHSCSTKKVLIPELYSDVLVRACSMCYYQMELEKEMRSSMAPDSDECSDEWQFTGNPKHDSLVRDEFSYEHAPNVSLCLSICDLFPNNTEYSRFLLDQAKKLEIFFRPIEAGHANPELDYELLAKIVKCLALAAKMRGGSNEFNDIIDHSEIIQALVENGCEKLLPTEPLNVHSLRKLRDSLIKAEQWSLSLDISLKYHFPTTGVFSSWGLALLKSGCFMAAREKFQHCLKPVEGINMQLQSLFQTDFSITQKQMNDIEQTKRPQQSPGLLLEILNILESNVQYVSIESPKNRVSTLTKLLGHKERDIIEQNDHALNIIARLENLKNISQGVFNEVIQERKTYREARELDNSSKLFLYENQMFAARHNDEALFYLTHHASHADIIDFLVRNFQIIAALRYLLLQKIDPEIFIEHIYYPVLQQKNVVVVFEYMTRVDETLMIWKDYILQLCQHLERRKSKFRELYDIQVLICDRVRASITCVKFYTANAKTYTDLENEKHHLLRAQKHLEEEFELAKNWEDIKGKREEQTIVMRKGAKNLSTFLNTIARQLEVTTFLAACETNGVNVCGSIPQICDTKITLPTLFDESQAKIILSVMVIVHARCVQGGFEIACKIIQDYTLDPVKVYGIAVKYFAASDRLREITDLMHAIRSKTTNDKDQVSLCDEILCLAVKTASEFHGNARKSEISALINDVSEISSKIRCYIVSNQLKSAYLMAVQNDRANDIRKIQRQAELTNQMQIKKLCEKKLASMKPS